MGGLDLGAPPGYIDRQSSERNQARIADNTRPRAHEPGGAVREGQALLRGIAVCRRCGRKLRVHYQGRRGPQSPAYHCPGSLLVEGRGQWCLRIGGAQIDAAVAGALLAAINPGRCEGGPARRRGARAGSRRRARQWRLQVERARYEAEGAGSVRCSV
jgi:Recombinase zinc beta ribbon domain